MPKRKEPDPSSSTGVVLEASSASDLNTKGSPAKAKRQKTDQAPPQTKDSKKKSASVELPEASKRLAVPGKQRRLGTSATAGTSKVNRISGSTRRNVTLSGNKVNFGLGTGGFEGVEKDASPKEEELWVTRKAGFAFLLKRALGAFTHRGCSRLTLRAMGAAIPVALTLALAVPDQLPCGSQGIDTRVETGSTDCYDEILPQDEQGQEDEEQDPQYQTRVKSTIMVRLALKQNMPQPTKKSNKKR